MSSRFLRRNAMMLAAIMSIFAFAFSPTEITAQSDSPPPPINVGAPVRKVSYQSSATRTPSWQRTGQIRMASQPMAEEVGPGEIIEQMPYSDRVLVEGGYEHFEEGCGPGGCGDGFCGDGGCDPCGYDPHRASYCAGLLWENLEISAGVAGFKGTLDAGRNGNFGFQYGANMGVPLFPHWGIGGQIGVRGVSVNYEGQQTTGPYVEDSRDQVFSTIGIFHHATDCNPWNWGVVYDQLHDEYWDEFDFGQVRAELGFVTHHCNEFGFMITNSTKESDGQYDGWIDETFDTHDQYAFYFRRYLCHDGEVRGWVGLTGDGDGIVGGDFSIPISDRFSFEANFNYLIPDNDQSEQLQQVNEAWAIGMNFVWHTRPGAFCHRKNPYHAKFSVADNVSMLRRHVP